MSATRLALGAGAIDPEVPVTPRRRVTAVQGGVLPLAAKGAPTLTGTKQSLGLSASAGSSGGGTVLLCSTPVTFNGRAR